jgi:hypothetical protein
VVQPDNTTKMVRGSRWASFRIYEDGTYTISRKRWKSLEGRVIRAADEDKDKKLSDEGMSVSTVS